VDQLVSFVDFAPTVLSLAGVKVADHMQGVAFLGQQAGPPRQYIHGFRDRMDERYDMIRAVRDSRYKYIRNFQPHKPYFHGQYLGYANRMPTLRIWQEMSRTGDLNEVQMQWMGPGKPVEELYDTQADPWEVNNLVESPDHRSKLVELREELHRWMIGIRDLSLLPESDMRTRFGGRPEYEAVRAEPESFPVERLLRAAYRVTSDVTADPLTNRELISAYLEDADPALRWWGAMGLNALPPHQVGAERLRAHLNDSAPDVRIEIAEALVRIGHADEALPVLEAALKHENDWVRVRAANAVDNLDELARPLIEALQAAAKHPNEYVYRSA
jgi:N-sulfoglucosamine sulfohydrolase